MAANDDTISLSRPSDPWQPILEQTIDELSEELRSFSLKMFEYAEIAMKEYKTHDLLAKFMEQQPGEVLPDIFARSPEVAYMAYLYSGWKVTRHAHGMETAVQAVFTRGQGGRTVGFNSEMDALPIIGYATAQSSLEVIVLTLFSDVG